MRPEGRYDPLKGNRSRYKDKAVWRIEYDGVISAVEDALAGPRSATKPLTESHKERADHRWDLGLGWDGAVKMAATGWAEGRENVDIIAREIREHIESTSVLTYQKPQILASVAGSIANVPAYIAGQPEAMFDWQLADNAGPVVEIIIEQCASAGIAADYYATRGAAVCALIDMLEASGKRCAVTLVMTIAHRQHNVIADFRTVLKRPGDALDMDAIAYAVAHPGYFRRIGFAQIENVPDAAGLSIALAITKDAYGRPMDTAFERGDVYIPAMKYDDKEWQNGKNARAWVMNRLKEHGVVID